MSKRAVPLSLMALLLGIYGAIIVFAASHVTAVSSASRSKAPEEVQQAVETEPQGDSGRAGCATAVSDRPGTVKFFSLSQGYGLVRYDGDKEAILNLGVIFGSGVNELRPGVAVTVDVTQKNCDANAKRYVTKIRPADPAPAASEQPPSPGDH